MIDIIKYIIAILFLDQVISAILKKTGKKWKSFVLLSLLALLHAISYEMIIHNLPTNFYQNLSVERRFSKEALRKSFRKLAVIYHPDKQHSEEIREKEQNRFEDLSKQYETLANTDLRLIYDSFGPEPIYLYGNELKEERVMQVYNQRKENANKNDVIYFVLFGISFIAMCSNDSLKTCRKICLLIVFAFLALRVYFYWEDAQVYDVLDDIFPKLAIFERIYILKAYIGIICVTLKAIFMSKYVKPDSVILEKLTRVSKLQEEIQLQAKTNDSSELIKIANQRPDIKKILEEMNKLMKETAAICENNSIENKKKIKTQRKRKIKASIMSILIFVWVYYFLPLNNLF